MADKPRKPLFARLKAGLEEGIAHAKGEITLKTTVFPAGPPEIDGKTVVALRESAAMSQSLFAGVLFVSLKTVQSWEQGKRKPSKAARRLLHVFALRPDSVCEVVGIKAAHLGKFTVEAKGKGRRLVKRPQTVKAPEPAAV